MILSDIQGHLGLSIVSLFKCDFITRRYASAVYAVVVSPSVRPSVRLSVRHMPVVYQNG